MTVRDSATAFPLAEVRPHNGSPALFVDGEPVFPLFHMNWALKRENIAAVARRGIHLFTTDLPHGWVGVDTYDFTGTDRTMAGLLEADPDVLFMPRVILSAPADWMDAHPEEVVDYADPAGWEDERDWGGARHPSWASRLWRSDACEALRRLVRHVRARDYARHIIAWHIGSGIYGEWHYWNAVYYPDTSPAFVRAYGEWLAQRYPDAPPEPRIPTVQERRRGSLGMFREPVAFRWLIDHAEFFHQLGAETLAAFARVVKEETAGRSLVLAFNGYLPDLDVNHEIDHRAFDRTLRCPDVDCFASPHSYVRRAPGDDAIMRGFPGSVRALGKLWFDEEDDRTFLASESPHRHVCTAQESVEVLWRGFAQALTHSCGLWFMDQQGGWYAHPMILDAFERMQRVGEQSMTRPRARASEVAVVASLRTAFYVADRFSGLDQVSDLLVNAQLAELSKCGAPFDMYLVSEVFEPGVPDYKAYVFLDTFFMSEEELARVGALRDAGKTLLFFYAPAFVSEEALSVSRMRDLLGMDVTIVGSIRLPNGAEQRPGFSVQGADRDMARSQNVFYCAAPPLAARLLRAVLREAGVHIYLDSDDPLMVGGGYLAVHAASRGQKVIRNSRPAEWVDVRTGAVLARRAAELQVEMSRGETLVLSLSA